MLTKEEKIEIKGLRGEGFNVSQISKKLKLDWKSVKKVLSEGSDKREEDPPQCKAIPQDQSEIEKQIFQKLNAGISPREIAAQLGHVDMVTALYQKWKVLGYGLLHISNRPDSKIKENSETWEESVKRFPEWHLNRMMQFVSEFVYLRMVNCKNYRSRRAKCLQLEDESDPYNCIGCGSSTLDDFEIGYCL